MTSQIGITQEEGSSAVYLTLTAGSNDKKLLAACAGAFDFVSTVSRLDPKAKLAVTVSFGSDFWNRISPRARPKAFAPLQAMHGAGGEVPSTGGDVFFHIKSLRQDICFEMGTRLVASLRGLATVKEEVTGFTYLDSRDLTGFIDGTQNPKGAERNEVALIGSEDSAFAGGSYVLTHRFIHLLSKWSELDPARQERLVGRAKADSAELTGDAKLPTSHISRAETHVNGEELKIVRHSLPYGTVSGDQGLFFIAYAKAPQIFYQMLSRLYGTSGDGLHDEMMEYTRAVTGAVFFTPSLQVLSSFK